MKKLLSLLIFLLYFSSVWGQAAKSDSIKLYWKCRNDLTLSYLVQNYVPSDNVIKLKGARLIENADNNRLSIMPESAVATVEIWRKDQFVKSIPFYSVQPPAPVFELKINGMSFFSYDNSASGSLPTSIAITTIADEAFRMMLPKDSHYVIKKWEVSLMRGGKSIGHFSFDKEIAPAPEIDKIQSLAKSGDVMQIKLLTVKRVNALDELIDQSMRYNTIDYTIK